MTDTDDDLEISTIVRPEGFSLDIPESWARFDLSLAPLAKIRADAMRAAADVSQRLQIDDAFEQAKSVMRNARRWGALWAAGTMTLYDDALFMGTIMVFRVTSPDETSFTYPVLSSALGRPRAEDATDADLGQRVVEPVSLPNVGRAVRVTGFERAKVVEDEPPVTFLINHTFVPLPRSSEDYLLVSCSSPNLDLREPVLELFNVITDTLTFTASG